MEVAHRFTHIFSSFSYPGSVFILTDPIGADTLVLEDFLLLSHFLIAVIIVKGNYDESSLNISKICPNGIITNLEHSRGGINSKPSFILDLPLEINVIVARHIYDSFHASSSYVTTVIENKNQSLVAPPTVIYSSRWKPTMFIIYKTKLLDPVDHNVALSTFEESFANITLHLDTSIFLILFEKLLKWSRRQNVDELFESISAWEIYNVKERRVFHWVSTVFLEENIEDLSLHQGISLENHGKRRSNFFGEKFIGAVKPVDASNVDWGETKMRPDGTYYLTRGYIANLYWELKTRMNFTEDVVIGDTPYANSTGSLVGETLELLRSGKADFALNKMSFNPIRARALAYLIPTHNSLAYVFFKQPSPNSLRNIVTAPFTKELWLTLAVFWIGLAFYLHVRLTRMGNSGVITERDESFLEESWVWCVATMCQKSFHLDPQTASLKFKFIVGSLLSIISYTAYSASIVSSLAVSNIPIKSFYDLTSSDFVFTVHEQSQPFQNFLQGLINSFNLRQKVSTVSTEKEISQLFKVSKDAKLKWQTLSTNDFILSTKKAFLSYADMFYNAADFQNYSSSFVCQHLSFFRLEVGSYLSKSAMMVTKGSQNKEVLNYMLLYLRGYGLIYRNDKNYNSNNMLQCLPEDAVISIQATDFSDIFTILLVLLIGMAWTTLVFTVEFIMYKYQNHLRLSN